MNPQPAIVPRQDLDFRLHDDIPRFWFGGDPFRTRLFDAHSLLVPAGERFFINCVRDYRDRIGDPQLREAVRAFILQEGQHSQQHALSNQRLAAQGVAVAEIEARQQHDAEALRRAAPRSFSLALTAAYEHITTIVANAVTEHGEYFADADPRIYALYAWHCAEELEHKAVSYDVMQQVAGVGYLLRVFAMIFGTWMFSVQFVATINRLFRADGFSFRQRLHLWRHGLGWMYGRKGFFTLQIGHYYAWFRPGFHPAKVGGLAGYQRWRETYVRTNDPFAAAAAMRATPAG